MQSGPNEKTGLTSGSKKPDRFLFWGTPVYLFGNRPSLTTALNATEAKPVIEVKPAGLPHSDTEDRPDDMVDLRTIEMINLIEDETELAQGSGSFQADNDTGIQSDQEEADEREEPSILQNLSNGVSLMWSSIWSCSMCGSNLPNIPEESRPINRK